MRAEWRRRWRRGCVCGRVALMAASPEGSGGRSGHGVVWCGCVALMAALAGRAAAEGPGMALCAVAAWR